MSSSYGRIRSPERSALAARAMIALFLLVVGVQVLGNLVVLYLELSSGGTPWMRDPFTGEGVDVYNGLIALALGRAVLVIVAVFLLAAVPVTLWIYHAHAVLRDAEVPELVYSPAWAVAGYFIPLVNLVVPFRAMRELYNRSHGEAPWDATASVAAVSSWWSCHLAAFFVMAVASLVAAAASIPGLYVVQPPGVNTGLFLFALLLLAGAAIYLLRIIGAVSEAQRHGLFLPDIQSG